MSDKEEEDEKQENFFHGSKQSTTQLKNPITNTDNELLSKKRKKPENIDDKFVKAKDYYTTNGVRDPGKEGRKASRIIFLRSYNNWVKATMINKYCSLLSNPTSSKQLSILDLCCGKGGDLDKFFTQKKVRLYVGADISKEALDNAQERLNKIKNEKYSNKNDFNTKCVFIVEDLSDPNNHLLEKINKDYYFDLVTCQFALHYHFETKEKLNAFLKNVTARLNFGGYFIGTIIDDNVIVKRLRNSDKLNNNIYKNEEYTFGNEFYSVKFSQDKFNKKDGIFGKKYGFYLEDSIDKRNENGQIEYIGEYLIIFNEFVKLCEDYDLHLIEKENFTDFYKKYTKEKAYDNLSKKMLKDLSNKKINEQWEIVQLNAMFAFQKGIPEKDFKYVPYLENNKDIIKDEKVEYNKGKFD